MRSLPFPLKRAAKLRGLDKAECEEVLQIAKSRPISIEETFSLYMASGKNRAIVELRLEAAAAAGISPWALIT